MDVREIVTGHYGGQELAPALLAALARAGVDVDQLSVADLAPIDQLHAGFAPATTYLLEQLDLPPGSRLLDVGSGIGGPSRLAASAFGLDVTGIDLTPEFVQAASDLTEKVGLSARARFEVTSGDDLPFGDRSFDAAMMIHVGMNIPDKQAVFSQVHRVLEPGGVFAVYEQMRKAEGDLPYPMPWAVDERSSFVETPEQYADQLRTAGFAVESVEDRTFAVAGPPPAAGSGANAMPFGADAVIFGPDFGRRIGNNIEATKAGLLGAVLILARA